MIWDLGAACVAWGACVGELGMGLWGEASWRLRHD